MVSRDDGKYVIWPEYFDASRSRKSGRRVPTRLAVKSPSLKDLIKAAEEIDLSPTIENDAAHPSTWWQKNGRILIRRKSSKTQTLRWLGKRIKMTRQGKSIGSADKPKVESGKRKSSGKKNKKNKKK